MNHSLYLSSKEILDLPSSLLEKVLDSVSTYDMEGKNAEEFTSEDIELYSKTVEAQFHRKEDKGNYINYVGFLSEKLGLQVLKDKESYQIEDVREYQMPKSHVDYINSLSEEVKSSLKNTFFEEYIKVAFVPTTVRKVREILNLNGTPYISFGDSYSYSNSLFTKATTMGDSYTGTTKGYLFPSVEVAEKLVEKIADFEFAINLAKEKLTWEHGTTRYSKFYNVPKIVPVFSGETRDYVVAGAWDNAKTGFTAGMVVDVQLNGSVKDMFYLESTSIYNSDYCMTDDRVAAAKELGIPVTEKYYVPKGREEEIYQKVRENLAIEEATFRSQVEQALAERGLTGSFHFDNSGNMYVNVAISYEDGFTYTVTSHRDYSNDIYAVMSFIENFNPYEVETTYRWQKEREQFLADQEGLPTV